MTENVRVPGPETIAAIERAIQAAQLRSADSPGASTITDWEPSAAESGDIGEGADGD